MKLAKIVSFIFILILVGLAAWQIYKFTQPYLMSKELFLRGKGHVDIYNDENPLKDPTIRIATRMNSDWNKFNEDGTTKVGIEPSIKEENNWYNSPQRYTIRIDELSNKREDHI